MARPSPSSQSRLTLAAHELRTPLSVAVGYLRLLRRQASPALPAELVRLLDESERACDRLAALMTEISRLGQLEAGTLPWASAEVDAGEVLREVAAGQAAGGVMDEAPRSPSIIWADPERLREAFESLIRVAARRLGARPPAVGLRHVGGHLVIAIADAAMLPALLDADPPVCPFDETPGGFGVALPFARSVIERAGGTLESPCADKVALPGALVRWRLGARASASRRRGVR